MKMTSLRSVCKMLPVFLVLFNVNETVPHPTDGKVCKPVLCENGEDCLSSPSDEVGLTSASDWEEPTGGGPCHPNPCHNGGVCESGAIHRGDSFVGYLCKCPPGFNGIHCQHNINECAKTPCKNGGICTDLEANYTCECPGEFMGRNCQYSVFLRRVFKVANLLGSSIAMLSKQGSRSSLRASLKALFPSKSQTSLCLDNGDGQEGSQDCLTDQNKATQTDSDLSYVWTNGDEVSKRKDTRASEDAVSITSRETASRNESREADLSLYSRSRDTSFIEESKDAGFNKSGCPVDTLDEGKLAKDCMSEADTISVTGTIDSRIDDLSPVKAKPCCECYGPLGMEGGIISNQQITASSTQRAVLGLQKWHPHFARLNRKGLVNAWSAAESDRWPWIQINLLRRMRITGVITQGAKRMGKPEYVKSYKVAFSEDGETWRMYIDRGTDQDQTFRGNIDNNSPSANSFTPPIEAQYIRIYPQVCRGHCTLRMELLGCELTGCSEPMGMKTGHIQDFQISSSSVYQTLNMDMFSWTPGKARLDKEGKVNAWSSAANDQSQWLQVDMLLPTKVTGIITQGSKYFGRMQFVGSYKVAFSNDGEKWLVYQDETQQQDKIFQGNFDNETHRKNVVDPPIYARFIRILPWSWYGRIALRTELLGCSEEEE